MIKLNRPRVVLAVVLVLVDAPTFAASSVDALASRLDGVVNRAIDEHRIVGTVVLVAKDGNIVYHRAAGFSDREAQQPMTEAAIFRLASMTKPIVSATVLALVQQGRLTLDDPVTKWLPEFRPKMANGRTPLITIRQLLTHTAGLSYHPSSHSGRSGDKPIDIDEPGLPMEERLRRIGRLELLFQPGTQWSYS
jgi:CubicO group peptidase (beta-lactamase class C family)